MAVHVRGGSYGTLSESATGSLAGEGARATAVLRHEDVLDGISQADVANGNRERDGYWGNLAQLHYSAEPGEHLALDGTFYYGLTHADIDGPGGTQADHRSAPMDDRTAYGRTETWLAQHTVTARLDPTWESSLKLGYHKTVPRLHMNGTTVQSDSTLMLIRWRNEHSLKVPGVADHNLRFAWGTEARQEEGMAETSPGKLHKRRGQVAGFADVDMGFGPWSTVAGFRFDHYDEFATHGTYYLGIRFHATDTLALRASGGHGYRIPSYHEWYFPFIGNPGLKPESADSGQLGVDWEPAADLHVSATAYYQRYRNLIQISFVPELGNFRTDNVARADVRGVELEARYGSQPWQIGLSYTFQDSRDPDTGRSLARLPRNLGKVFGLWKPLPLPVNLNAEVLYRSGYFDDIGGTLRIDQYFQVNAQIAYIVSPQLQVYVRGENLSDDRTPDDFGFGKPGVAVYGGVKLEFR